MWLDYKQLKKLIKRIPAGVRESTKEDKGDQKTQLKASEDERRFFLLLRKELKKVATCFKDLEYRALRKLVNLKATYSREVNTKSITLQNYHQLLQMCTRMHMELLMLENYAVLNYAGFTKILKKHDKMTGFRTKDQFLLKLVDCQPFVVHPWLRSAIKSVEDQFRSIDSIAKTNQPQQQTQETSSAPSGSPKPTGQSNVSAFSAPAPITRGPASEESVNNNNNNNNSNKATPRPSQGSTELPLGSSSPSSSAATLPPSLGQLMSAATAEKTSSTPASPTSSSGQNQQQHSQATSTGLRPSSPSLLSLMLAQNHGANNAGGTLSGEATSPGPNNVHVPDSLLRLSTEPEFHKQLLQAHLLLERTQGVSWLRNAFDRANIYQNMPVSAISSSSSPITASGVIGMNTSALLSSVRSKLSGDGQNIGGTDGNGSCLSEDNSTSSEGNSVTNDSVQGIEKPGIGLAQTTPFSLTRTLDTLAMLAQQAQFRAAGLGSCESTAGTVSNQGVGNVTLAQQAAGGGSGTKRPHESTLSNAFLASLLNRSQSPSQAQLLQGQQLQQQLESEGSAAKRRKSSD